MIIKYFSVVENGPFFSIWYIWIFINLCKVMSFPFNLWYITVLISFKSKTIFPYLFWSNINVQRPIQLSWRTSHTKDIKIYVPSIYLSTSSLPINFQLWCMVFMKYIWPIFNMEHINYLFEYLNVLRNIKFVNHL